MLIKIYQITNPNGTFTKFDLIFSNKELKQSQTGKAMIWNGSLDIFYKELSSTENYNLLFKPLILKTEQTQEQCNLPNIDLIDLDIQGLIIKSNPDKNELIKWLNNLIVFVKNYEKMDKQEDKEISLDE